MKDCDFECSYLDDCGECEPMQSECIGDMCENYGDCGNCQRSRDCEEQGVK